MKKALLPLFLLFCSVAHAQEIELMDNTKVNWVTIEEAISLVESGKNTKVLMVDTYTDWCGWCKKMDRNTFTDPKVIEILNEHFLAVKFDAEAERDINFRGHTLKFVPGGRKGYHQLAAALMNGKLSFPTLVFLNEDFEMIQPIPGYRTAEDLLPIITYLGQKLYLDTPYKKFLKAYNASDDED